MGYTESIVGRMHARKSLLEKRVNPSDLQDTSLNEFHKEVSIQQLIALRGHLS